MKGACGDIVRIRDAGQDSAMAKAQNLMVRGLSLAIKKAKLKGASLFGF